MSAAEKVEHYQNNLITNRPFNIAIAKDDEAVYAMNAEFYVEGTADTVECTIGYITKKAIIASGLTREQLEACLRDIPAHVRELCPQMKSYTFVIVDDITDTCQYETLEDVVGILYPGYEFKEIYPEEAYQTLAVFKTVISHVNQGLAPRMGAVDIIHSLETTRQFVRDYVYQSNQGLVQDAVKMTPEEFDKHHYKSPTETALAKKHLRGAFTEVRTDSGE
jgi:hypothetical protein